MNAWGARKRGRLSLDPAIDLARSEIADAEALQKLAPLVARHPETAERALEVGKRSVAPDTDRAYRLISAVVEGGPVKPVDPAKAPMIREFERWVELPVGTAFRQLSDLGPDLQPIGAEAEEWHRKHPDADIEQRVRIHRRLGRAVGRLFEDARDSEHVVIRCGLARTIALQYVGVALGNHVRGDERTPVAQIMATPYRVTITFGRPPTG
jgi:hypothetical protein